MQYFSFCSPCSPSWTGHLQCHHSTTSLIMHSLRETCGPQYKSYFCVKENIVICLLYSKYRDHIATTSPRHCLPTTATLTGIYEMINSPKLQGVAQAKAEMIQMPTAIWRLSFFKLLFNADSLFWQWITPTQYAAQLVTATYISHSAGVFMAPAASSHVAHSSVVHCSL